MVVERIYAGAQVAADAVIANPHVHAMLARGNVGARRSGRRGERSYGAVRAVRSGWVKYTGGHERRAKPDVARGAIDIRQLVEVTAPIGGNRGRIAAVGSVKLLDKVERSEEHTSEL